MKKDEPSDVTLSFCVTMAEARPVYREATRLRMSVSRYLRLLVSQRLAEHASSAHREDSVKTLKKSADL